MPKERKKCTIVPQCIKKTAVMPSMESAYLLTLFMSKFKFIIGFYRYIFEHSILMNPDLAFLDFVESFKSNDAFSMFMNYKLIAYLDLCTSYVNDFFFFFLF